MKNTYFIIIIALMLNNCSGVTPYNNDVTFDDPRKNIEQFNFKENNAINFNYDESDLKKQKYETISFDNPNNFGSQQYVELDKKIKNEDVIDFNKVEKLSFDNTENIDFNKVEKLSFDNTESVDFKQTEEINFNKIEKNEIQNKLINSKEYEIINVDEIMKKDKEETTVVKSTIKEIPGKIFDLIIHPGKVVANALYPTTIDIVNEHNSKNVKEYLGEQYENEVDYKLGKKIEYDEEDFN